MTSTNIIPSAAASLHERILSTQERIAHLDVYIAKRQADMAADVKTRQDLEAQLANAHKNKDEVEEQYVQKQLDDKRADIDIIAKELFELYRERERREEKEEKAKQQEKEEREEERKRNEEMPPDCINIFSWAASPKIRTNLWPWSFSLSSLFGQCVGLTRGNSSTSSSETHSSAESSCSISSLFGSSKKLKVA